MIGIGNINNSTKDNNCEIVTGMLPSNTVHMIPGNNSLEYNNNDVIQCSVLRQDDNKMIRCCIYTACACK